MRFHPKVVGLKFKEGVKRVDKTNARVAYICDDMTPAERPLFDANFDEPPVMLTAEERAAWMADLKGVALSSDAFFPFRDNIDTATKCVPWSGPRGRRAAGDGGLAGWD